MDPEVQPFVEKYEVAVAFAKEFVEELGEARAHPIIKRAFEKMQIKAAQDLAERLGSNSLEALAEDSRRRAAERDTLEVVEVTDKHVALKLTRCRAFEAFSYLGAPEICRLYCDSDDAYIQAFNPKMKMVRTKTIAGGDAYCDHTWVLDE
jgi:hypothetical protein